jgi:coproporphyrinogen III oxidase-like Fe-S oxidoreductase
MDRLLSGVRLREGLSPADTIARAEPLGAADSIERVITHTVARGWMTSTPDRWSLTDAGFLFADRVAADLIGAIPDQPAV